MRFLERDSSRTIDLEIVQHQPMIESNACPGTKNETGTMLLMAKTRRKTKYLIRVK